MASAPAPRAASGEYRAPVHLDHRPGRVDRHRQDLRSRLDGLLGVNALHLPHQTLAALRALWSTSTDLLRTPLPATPEAHDLHVQVALIDERVEARMQPWVDVVTPPTDHDTRVALATTVLRLCLDLQELADRLHPGLRVLRGSPSAFAVWAGRVVTLQGFYLDDTFPSHTPAGERPS